MKTKGFILDLDDVITSTWKIHFKAWRQEVGKIGINFTYEDNIKLKGLSREKTLISILKNNGIYSDFSQDEINKMAERKNKNNIKILNKFLKKGDWLDGIDIFLKACEIIDILQYEAIGFEDALEGVKGCEYFYCSNYAWGYRQLK